MAPVCTASTFLFTISSGEPTSSPKKCSFIVAAVVVLVVVLTCGVVGVLAQRQPMLTQQEIEQRALLMAQQEWGGNVTALAVRAVPLQARLPRCAVGDRVFFSSVVVIGCPALPS